MTKTRNRRPYLMWGLIVLGLLPLLVAVALITPAMPTGGHRVSADDNAIRKAVYSSIREYAAQHHLGLDGGGGRLPDHEGASPYRTRYVMFTTYVPPYRTDSNILCIIFAFGC